MHLLSTDTLGAPNQPGQPLAARKHDKYVFKLNNAVHSSTLIRERFPLPAGATLGRSFLMRGEHAVRQEVPERAAPLAPPSRRPWRVGIDFPAFALDRWRVRAFDALYFRRNRPGIDAVDLEPFFYPLDAILEWSHIYSAPCLFRYQRVLPPAATVFICCRGGSRRAVADLFLSVLERFGSERRAGCRPAVPPDGGYALAPDFRAIRASVWLAEELDAIVADDGA